MAIAGLTASQTVGAGHRVRPRRLVPWAVAVLLLAGLWLQLAPVAVGGPASYVVTDGTSMLPRFHADGLVITRRESSYHVGEVAAYHNQQLHAVVMHRIVAIHGDRYVFRGDNNDFRDSYHPTKDQIVGKEWVYWQGGGRWLLMLRTPLVFGIVVFVVTALAIRSPARTIRRRRRHHAR